MKAQLILEDGTVFIGDGFGSHMDTIGEVVFNTGMTGYQEILSDPSYCGQIVMLTYPLIGNYGINRDDFESINPAVKGFIVKEVTDSPSNWRSEFTINEYFKMKKIPGIAGIDTRKLTRIIRQYGTLKGAICSIDRDPYEVVSRLRQTRLPIDQVRTVSTKNSYPSPGRGKRIVLVDFGMKHGILRELNKRGCDVIVVPYHTTADEILQLRPDGIMLSNGPGDPKDVPEAIHMIKQVLGMVPIFGICLGHQLFALACGANTVKMKFGHRGSNHPVKELATGKISITSQNHGYTVETESLHQTRLAVTHTALNDGTIEGLKHLDFPAFTVQYHPEASPGPEDANSLFEQFLAMIEAEKTGGNSNMPKRTDINSILVIGSGPIVIGQAAEFDYAGTQACIALKEEGYRVILVNSNPATIMTDTEIADATYIEPLTVEFVSRIIRKERPDALVATLGGQTGLNLAVELAKTGVLEECEVEILGTKLPAINQAEDRELFRSLMNELNEPVPDSEIIHEIEEAKAFVEKIGFPVIVRPAFTLGGTGGGICRNYDELEEIVTSGLKNSPVHQCLLEKSIAGYKEIEYEVMRDAADNAIVVCNMENIDPVGVHTGDSIVVAPSQTLSDREYQLLRNVSLKIIRALGIEGGCNVQLALDPYSFNYYIIEVNPRVSRSSALASKATGYPIAKLAAKIAVGLTLDEMLNPVTGKTYACFEPALDYIVTKIPRWPFDKFESGNRSLGTQMKATGEVMAIGRTFEESLLKAIRSLECEVHHFELNGADDIDDELLEKRIIKAGDERLFYIAESLKRGTSIETIHQWSKIDLFFLKKMEGIIDLEVKLAACPFDRELLKEAKQKGFSDKKIAELWNRSESEIYSLRKELGIIPVYKMVDTCASEFESETPYYYGTYEDENESVVTSKDSVIVLGSGPIRIGQGIEFDYATVHSVKAIKEAGYEAIIINNNPETVSTDFSISDKLYFEPLTIEDVMQIIDLENPIGVVVQFGGQTAINLAAELVEHGVKILGTSLEDVDRAEDRDKFEQALNQLTIPQPLGKTALSVKDAVIIAEEIGYPVLVRPSYVLGGRAMEIVYQRQELLHYMENAVKINPEHPVLIDRYLTGKEIEVDAICDGENVLIPGIMEHIERAGVHSGDSIAVYPPQSLSENVKQTLVEYTEKLARGLNIIGLLNIQYVLSGDQVYVLEVNPRSSRTVPFLSKITNVPMAKIATKAILGISIIKQGYQPGLIPEKNGVYVKVPVFSFAKLKSVDITLGPEMKSTGEVMGKDHTLEKALYKGLIASGMNIQRFGTVLFTVADKDKEEALKLAVRFAANGYRIMATSGTAAVLESAGLKVKVVGKIGSEGQTLLDVIHHGEVQFIINTLTKGKQPARDGFRIRREAVENGVPCLTSLDTANAILRVIESMNFSTEAMGAAIKEEVLV